MTPIRRRLVHLSIGLLGLCLACKGLSMFDEDIPGGSLLAALQLQFVWIALAGVSGLLVCRAWKAAGGGLLLLAWCSTAWLPMPGGLCPANVTEWTPVKLVTANVMTDDHTQPAAFVAYAKSCGADVIGLQEVQGKFWPDLIRRELIAAYPYQHFHGGIGVISRIPLGNIQAVDLGTPGRDALSAVLETAAGPVSLLVVHPNRPRWGESKRNATQLARLAEVAAARPAPKIIMGDFNASPWNASMTRIPLEGGLRGASAGRSPVQTYAKKGNLRPWAWYYRLAGIPIDHVLVSPDIAVLSRTAGPHHGSDHLPLEVVLKLPPRAPSLADKS